MQALASLARKYEKEKTAKGEKKDRLKEGNTSLSPYYNTIKEMNLCAPPFTLKRKEQKRKVSDRFNQPPIRWK